MRFDGYMICTDLDGTLLRTDKSISEENLKAIRYFEKRGGIFTFITGRMPYFSGEICEMLNAKAPYGCINGGGVYDPVAGRYLYVRTCERSVLDLVAFVDEHFPAIGIQINTPEHLYFCKENPAMEVFRRRTHTPFTPKAYRDIDEPIAKVTFGDLSDENIRELMQLPRLHPLGSTFDFVHPERMLFEILPRGIDKGVAFCHLGELYGIRPSYRIAIGDYDNDIPMLKAAGIRVAVSNASDGLKAVADHITVSNDEHAIAHLIESLENGTLSRREV